MNSIIKRELDKLNIKQCSNKILIPKKCDIKVDENSCYLIKLSETLLNKNCNEQLVYNYNNGNVPDCIYYIVDIVSVVGCMIKVSGIGYDFDKQEELAKIWIGWLPLNEVEVIKKY